MIFFSPFRKRAFIAVRLTYARILKIKNKHRHFEKKIVAPDYNRRMIMEV